MKKAAKVFSSSDGFKSVFSRKKRRGGILKNESGNKNVSSKAQNFESIDMEKKCLVEKTSFDYGKSGALTDRDNDQTPTGSKVKTKKALDKPLRKINFSPNSDDNDVLLGAPLVFLLPIKIFVNISVRKSFEKLQVVRKLFSKVNGFGRVSTLSKFARIIRATFTFELTADTKVRAVVIKEIPVGTSVEAVRAALSEFGVIKSMVYSYWKKCHLYFIGSVGGKTCVINCHPVTYGQARCAVVCFESADSLNAIMGTTPMLKGAHFCWSHIGSAVCAKYEKLGHISLGCVSGEKFSSDDIPCRVLSDANKSRLAAIYTKCSVPVAHPVFFGSVSWAKIVAGSSSTPLSVQDVLLFFGDEAYPTCAFRIE
ncbi:hypothetical protein G9A89_015154 [Geosiphon pyriformis]|nr:hypothetical protein G9A89_015154 [Geosiphon pyriformis]